MLLSVIVPVYNAQKYLRECLESVLRQSMGDFELLLVDDGSMDKSLEICQEYEKADDRIRVFEQQHNGPFAARKLGVGKANGKYVTFIDADDFIAADAYSHAVEDMMRGVDVISFGIHRYYDEDTIRETYDGLPQGAYDRQKMESRLFPIMIWDERNNSFGMDPSLCNKFYKRELVWDICNRIGNLKFHYGEDAAVIYPLLAAAETISVHHEAYYYHRQRKKGTVAPYITDHCYLDKLYLLYDHLRSWFKEKELFQRQIDMFYMHSVQLYKWKYGIVPYPPQMMFPFDRVERNDRIVLYGAGSVGRLFISQLKRINYCRVVMWVDRNYGALEAEVKSPSEILHVDYDKVVIAIDDKKIRTDVQRYLISIGIEKSSIIG